MIVVVDSIERTNMIDRELHYDRDLDTESDEDILVANGKGIFESKNAIDRRISTFMDWMMSEGCSIEAAIFRTDKIIDQAFDQYERKCRSRRSPLERLKQNAAKLLILNYPNDIKAQMHAAFENENYQQVLEIASSFESPQRERPHLGNTGPEEPLSINCDQHIKWETIKA